MSSTLMCRSARWKLLCLALESWYFRSSLRNWGRRVCWREFGPTLEQESARQVGDTKKRKVFPLRTFRCAQTVHTLLQARPIQEWMGHKQTVQTHSLDVRLQSTNKQDGSGLGKKRLSAALVPVRAKKNIYFD